jgi:hypothetical protein
MKAKTIYIVTTGSYSDYGIVGAISSMEKAIKYRDAHGYNEDIEEYVVDAEYDQRIDNGYKCFLVSMDKDGNVTYCTNAAPWNHYFSHDSKLGAILHAFVWAKSKEDAYKIVGEYRTRLLALNLWGTRDAEALMSAIK